MVRRFILALACGLAASVTGQASGSILTTQFSSDNARLGNMFDVQVFDSPLMVTKLDLNITWYPGTIELWLKSGSYVGFASDQSAWTLHDTVALIGLGMDMPTTVDFADFLLSANSTTAIYVTYTDSGLMYYTDGTAVGQTAAENTELRILEGAGKADPFGETYEPRIWNGSIHYEIVTGHAIPEPTSLAIWSAIALGGLGLAYRRRRRQTA